MFTTSAMSCCCKKSMKSYTKIPSKTVFKSTPQVGSIWEPTLAHFGKVWGARMGPNWHQIVTKIKFRINQKTKTFRIDLDTNFGRILDPEMAPSRGAQKSLFEVLPLWGHLGAKMMAPRPPRHPKILHATPRTSQDLNLD